MEIGTLIRELGGGMWVSAEIFILTLLFSLPLGLVVAIREKCTKIAPVRWISKLYISIMRGTPLMTSVDGSGISDHINLFGNAHFHRIPYDCGADRFCN